MESPRVSIVIPTFNRGTYLRRALMSVLRQTYEDFEVIVVDDHSSDDTPQRVREIEDSRVKFLRHTSNRGASAARNTGVRAATGHFIAFLDSDDEWLPEKLDRQVRCFEQADSRVGLVYTGAVVVGPKGERLTLLPQVCGEALPALLRSNCIVGGTSSPMLRSEALQRIGGFDEALPARQDHDCWVRIGQLYQIAYVAEPQVLIHQPAGLERISSSWDRRCQGLEMFYAKHCDAIETFGLTTFYLNLLAHKSLNSMRWDARRARSLCSASIRRQYWQLDPYKFLLRSFLPRNWFMASRNVIKRLPLRLP